MTDPKSQWEPISTAPRDGPEIYAWPFDGTVQIASVWTVEDDGTPTDRGPRIIRHSGTGLDYFVRHTPVVTYMGQRRAPTHWHPKQPVPPPPEDV